MVNDRLQASRLIALAVAVFGLLGTTGLGACGSESPAPGPDAADTVEPDGEVNDAVTLRMEVGTGARDAFRSFEEGETLLLQRGLQGSQHVYVSLRIRDAAAGPLEFVIEIRRERDGEVVGGPYGHPVEMHRMLDANTGEVSGLTPIVPYPDEILDEDVQIRVSVTDAEERSVTVTRHAHIVWGPDAF